MTRYTYPHPGYGGKLYPICTVLRDLSAQENCDGEPYIVMMRAAEAIEELERRLDEAHHQRDKLADALIDTQKDVRDLKDAVDLLIFKSRRVTE